MWLNLLTTLVILLRYESDAAIGNDTSNCTEYRNNLATAISNFTLCAIENSRPITLCEYCVDAYINVIDSYKNLSETVKPDGHCIDDYVNLDRLQIVNTLYQNSFNLWNKAKCYECYEIINGALSHNRSEATKIFFEHLNKTETCIASTNKTQSIFCSKCVDDYLHLNTYYESISNINEKIGVCMDIVDLMNGTRSMWSQNCCEYRKQHNEYIFLASTCVVSFVTVLFYILAKCCTDIKKSTIVRQSRFAESFNQSTRS